MRLPDSRMCRTSSRNVRLPFAGRKSRSFPDTFRTSPMTPWRVYAHASRASSRIVEYEVFIGFLLARDGLGLQADALEKPRIPGIGAQRIDLRVRLDPRDAIGLLVDRFLERPKGGIPVAEPRVHGRDFVGTHVAARGSLLQRRKDFPGLPGFSRGGVRSAEHFQDCRAVVRSARFLEGRHRLFGLSLLFQGNAET